MTRLISSSFLLFVDGLILSIGGWLFWLLVSRYVEPSSIGISTAVFSLVGFVSSFATLGLEYPILKKTIDNKIDFGSVLILELIVHTLLSVPVVIYLVSLGSPLSLTEITIGVIMFFSIGMGFIAKHALLGIMDSTFVLVVDIMGTVVKFAATFALLPFGGILAILLGMLLQQVFLGLAMTYRASSKTNFRYSSLKKLIPDLHHGIVNLPSKTAKVLILNLSIVVLAAAGVQYSDVGIFYILLMIAVAASGFASSLAMMSIPASTLGQKDYSGTSLRFGLAISIPVLSLIVAAPKLVLQIVNPSYLPYADSLVVLGFSMVGYIITLNVITKANINRDLKLLIILGVTEASTFLVLFLILGTENLILTSLAVLVAYTLTSAVGLMKMPKNTIIVSAICSLALIVSWLTSIYVSEIIKNDAVGSLAGITVSVVVILGSRVISFTEIRGILHAIVSRTNTRM